MNHKLCWHTSARVKKDFGIRKKIDVIKAGLDLLEKEAQRMRRIKRWKHAAKLVSKNSHEVNQEFQLHSRIRHAIRRFDRIGKKSLTRLFRFIV